MRITISRIPTLLVVLTCLCGCDSNEETLDLNISGTVTSEVDGLPIEGAEFQLINSVYSTWKSIYARSDSAGRYTLSLTVDSQCRVILHCWATRHRSQSIYLNGQTPTATNSDSRLRCSSEPQTIDFLLAEG